MDYDSISIPSILYLFLVKLGLIFQMYHNHSMEEGVHQISEDSLILYEATGYTRWDEAYGINDDDIHESDVMSTGSETSTSCSSGSDDRESCSDSTGDYDVPDGQLLINSREVSEGRETSKPWEMKPLLRDDDESEDEITHKPISAKEVIEHNKLFGYKTADYWWVHDDKVYSDYFVAYLRPMTNDEIKESTKEEVRDLKRELANTASLTETLEEFEKVLCRFEVSLNRQPSIPGGDPNLLPFPTPHDFIPTDMRNSCVIGSRSFLILNLNPLVNPFMQVILLRLIGTNCDHGLIIGNHLTLIWTVNVPGNV